MNLDCKMTLTFSGFEHPCFEVWIHFGMLHDAGTLVYAGELETRTVTAIGLIKALANNRLLYADWCLKFLSMNFAYYMHYDA